MKKQGKRAIKAKGNTKESLLQKVQTQDTAYEPISVSLASTDTATNRSFRRSGDSQEVRQKFNNIADGMIPFHSATSNLSSVSTIDIKDAVELCQKAYYNVAVFRNTIELMTEFSTAPIYWRGGSKKSRKFFDAFWKRIGILALEDKFYRELFRSCNVFIMKFMGEINPEDLNKLTQVFGAESEFKTEKTSLPVKYSILNPADIQVGGTLSFANATYFKVLTAYELDRLRNPRTEEDKAMFDKLPPEIKKQIAKKSNGVVLLPLDMSKTIAVFLKKQDYEPFAVPMGYPVLEDINYKLEMKKIDIQVSRVMQQVILLVTLGESPKDGGSGVNQKHIDAIKAFFETESVARVLVADYTTKASFVAPSISEFLDPAKYAQIDKDIKEGLNNVLITDDEKFANASVKIQIFVERLNQSRQIFINEFLLPETKNIAKALGMKTYPEPYYEEIDLKDTLEYSKLFVRLTELGVLTPEECIESLETGRLPDVESSLESQEKFKPLRDKGLYEPIVGGPATQKEIAEKSRTTQMQIAQQKLSQQKGRPSGSKAPQTTKKVTPIGGSETFSVSTLKDVILASQKLHEDVKNVLAKKHKLKKLNDTQVSVANEIAELIIANEDRDSWKDKIQAYIDEPIDKNAERVAEINEIAATHELTPFFASLLYHSKKCQETE